MNDLGRNIVVRLCDGSSVKGWDYGESPLGVYVALDRDGDNIRFLPRGTYSSRHWSDEDVIEIRSDVVEFYEKAKSSAVADEHLAREVSRTLERTDFNEIRRLASAFDVLRRRFGGSYEHLQLASRPDKENQSDAIETLLDVRSRYFQLLDEVDRSGFGALVAEKSEMIRKAGMPHYDWWMWDTFHGGLLLEVMTYKAIDGKPSKAS